MDPTREDDRPKDGWHMDEPPCELHLGAAALIALLFIAWIVL